MILDRRAFILRHTRPQSPPHAPELTLYLADEVEAIWRMTEEALQQTGLEPPFWAFAWAGGQALARYVLDHPDEVRGRRVLDFATGSGMVAIAAMRAGAASALGCDIELFCEAAVALNAAANGVEVGFTGRDLLQAPAPEADVILAGDICYHSALAGPALRWLQAAHGRGTRVLLGDPGRAYLPREGLEPLARYQIRTTRDLEDREVRDTRVFTFRG